MTRGQYYGLMMVLLCAGISVLPPIVNNPNAWVDFRAVYAGTRCLISGHDPYKVNDLEREFRSEDGQFPPNNERFDQAVTLYVNLPTTFVIVAPLALMPWAPAHVLWMAFTTIAFLSALLLVWRIGATKSLEVSTLLACLLVANCEGFFTTGNTAGIVVGLCVIAVCCFLHDRFVWAGVLCLAVSLAIKPHDSGFIWLYFILAGGLNRRRAIQSFVVASTIALAAVVWISHVAPHWLQNWHANLATITAPGGIDDPGPYSFMSQYASMVIDLQAAVSVFWTDPHIYNLISYLVCGVLLTAWAVRTLRSGFTADRAFVALSAVTAFTMLITYHRSWDAKLVMLAIPACCTLWTAGNRIGKIAFLVTLVTVLVTGDIILGFFTLFSHHLPLGMTSITGKILTVLLLRPISLALLAMGVFYLWVYLRPPASSEQDDIARNSANILHSEVV